MGRMGSMGIMGGMGDGRARIAAYPESAWQSALAIVGTAWDSVRTRPARSQHFLDGIVRHGAAPRGADFVPGLAALDSKQYPPNHDPRLFEHGLAVADIRIGHDVLVEPAECGEQTGNVITTAQIERYCDAIARAFRPEKIILFGSHAYGRPHGDSDVDVLVIMPDAKRHGRRPSLAIRRKIPAGFPVDILVKEPRDIAERLREGDSLLEEIVNRGRVMYETGHS